jgi:PTS system nitrogen regulatory IIA component
VPAVPTAGGGLKSVPVLRLRDYLQRDLVLWDLPRLDKPSFMKELVARVVAVLPAVDEKELLDRLLEREAQQSTGIGDGLALPHATVGGLETTALLVGRCREGVDFEALDSEPVDLLFLLLGPEDAKDEHLRLLARVARLVSPEETLTELRSAAGPEQLFRMLLEQDARHV